MASRLGEAKTSDIVSAVDWMIANKSRYNIRVANFSLAGSSESSFRFDPLDKAVEELWLSGVVVVAAVGNNGSATGPVKIAAPGNDPFVITVGAVDTEGTIGRSDDDARLVVRVRADGGRLHEARPLGPGAVHRAPVPSGSYLVAREAHPRPRHRLHVDERHVVLGADRRRCGGAAARPQAVPDAEPGQGGADGLGPRTSRTRIRVPASARSTRPARAAIANPPNPNENLYAFVSNGDFNADAWASYVSVNANWTQSNWVSSNWVSANWVSSNWVASNWVASNWVSSNWVASNWVASNWVASNWAE